MAYRWPGNIRELKNVVERIVLKTDRPVLRPADLPAGRHPTRRIASRSAPAEPAASRGRELVAGRRAAGAMLKHGESFWSAVYPLFMSRDLTRTDLRRIVQIGLEKHQRQLSPAGALFNMPSEDYKRFLSFLRKHDCHLPFQRFRTVSGQSQGGSRPVAVAGYAG